MLYIYMGAKDAFRGEMRIYAVEGDHCSFISDYFIRIIV